MSASTQSTRVPVSAPIGRSLWPDVVAWVAVVLALPVQTLVKVNPSDVPWHLATARLAEQTGRWPTENTFSYTFPEHPVYQQYPVFQGALYAVWKLGGWEALSVLVAVACAAILLSFMRWAGPLATARRFALPWMLVVLALHTRLAPRPDLLSLLLLGTMLLSIQRYRDGRRWALLAVPVLHWIWVNGHQLFVVSFAVQGAFLAHLLVARLGPRLGRRFAGAREAAVAIGPPIAALAASAVVSFLGPLGARVVEVFAQTRGSLEHHRAHVAELARIWTEPLWLAVGLALSAGAVVALWRARRTLPVFEGLVFAFGCALATSAIRGLAYHALIAAAVTHRLMLVHPGPGLRSAVLRRYFRGLSVAAVVVGAVVVFRHRLAPPPGELGGMQAGVGRSVGDWPDTAITHLRADPPPGRMMNIPWSLANTIMWSWPDRPVFVDPRFESYPRAFLIEVMASYHDDAVLDAMIERYQPGWIFLDHRIDYLRARLRHLVERGWEVGYVDSATVVLVPVTDEMYRWRVRHLRDLLNDPPDLVAGPPARRARQRAQYARAMRALGEGEAAVHQMALALKEAGDPALRRELDWD